MIIELYNNFIIIISWLNNFNIILLEYCYDENDVRIMIKLYNNFDMIIKL